MPGFANLACIYLAAGEGRRFGGEKLEAELDGRMLGLYAARTLASLGFDRLVAVGNLANSQLNSILMDIGFELAINPDPAAGQAQSLALGIEAIVDSDASGVLVALADMPFIDASHLARLAETFDGISAICSTNVEARMPPAIFPRAAWSELQNRSGDQGARHLLANAVAIEGSFAMLRDIDCPEDLSA